MKYLLKSFGILALLIITTSFSMADANENEWKLELELSKPAYVLYEPIWLDATLTNISSDTLRTHGLVEPNHLGFTIELTDGNGQLVKYTGPQSLYGGGPGRLLLETGEQEFGSFDLLWLYSVSKGASGYLSPNWMFPYIPAGTYAVQAQYEGATSNELIFDIVEPTGDALEILALIEKANKAWVQDNTVPSSQLFRQVVEEYPNSDYAAHCFWLSLIYSQEVRDSKGQGTYDIRTIDRKMIMNYPNSGYSKIWFTGITREFDDDQKLEFLDKLLEEHPNTRFTKFAPQLRKLILDKKKGEN